MDIILPNQLGHFIPQLCCQTFELATFWILPADLSFLPFTDACEKYALCTLGLRRVPWLEGNGFLLHSASFFGLELQGCAAAKFLKNVTCIRNFEFFSSDIF